MVLSALFCDKVDIVAKQIMASKIIGLSRNGLSSNRHGARFGKPVFPPLPKNATNDLSCFIDWSNSLCFFRHFWLGWRIILKFFLIFGNG